MNSGGLNRKAILWSAAGLIALIPLHAFAEVPAILMEACSLLEPASKRIECLKVANRQTAPGSSAGYLPQSLYSAKDKSSATNPSSSRSAPRTSHSFSGGQTCFVGPRGGTYTITKSGRKNYGGC